MLRQGIVVMHPPAHADRGHADALGHFKIVEERGLGAISGADELTEIVRRVIASNEKAVADYRAGKEASLKFLLGQVMRETKGRATPQVAQSLIAAELAR